MREDFADSLAGEWAPGPRSRVDEASGVRWFRCACALGQSAHVRYVKGQ